VDLRACGEPPANLSPPPYFEESDGWTFDQLVAPHDTFPGVTSYWAARLRTIGDGLLSTPALRIWGANLNIDLVQPSALDGTVDGGTARTTPFCPDATKDFPGTPVDLSSYSGLVFWAKTNETQERRIRIMVHDLNSDPRHGRCNDPSLPGYPASGDPCYNGFLTTRQLSDEFKQYEIDFSELRRDPTWGYQPGDTLDLTKIYLIVFQVSSLHCASEVGAKCVVGVDGENNAALNFDFWIDDLYLVKRP
jgi:hypothetical protein